MKKKNLDHNGIDYWLSQSDLLSALMLVLLLIIMLLFLYLRLIPDHDEIDPDLGDTYDETTAYTYDDDDDDNNSGGGGDDNDFDYEIADDSDHQDDEMKAAVYVKVVDSETGKVIPQSDIRFRLYTGQNSLKVLHVYYPEKTSFKEYKTTKDGVFYLPEKLAWGSYYLKDLTTISGYMLSPNVEFEVDQSHDWSDPLVVQVELSPFKNTISIRVLDADTQKSVAGGSFDIVAQEDIVGKDGTVRYQAGTVVDTLVCNGDGYAISQELYLGTYSLVQKNVPAYYVAIDQPVAVDLAELSKDLRADSWNTDDDQQTAAQTQELLVRKTAVTLHLADEVDTGTALSGAEFLVTCDQDAAFQKRLTTDSYGELTVTDLMKNATYHFKQQSATGNYRILEPDYGVTVDENGRIDGIADYTLAAQNRLLRVAVSVTDKLLKEPVADVTVSLYRQDGTLLHSWTSGHTEELMTDLTTGSYYLTLGTDENSRIDFTVNDTAQTQTVGLEVYSTRGIAVFASVGAGLLLAIGLIVYLLTRLAKRKKKH